MMIVEMFEKPKLQFPINQHLLSYIYVLSTKCIFYMCLVLIDHLQIINPSTEVSKSQMAANHGG